MSASEVLERLAGVVKERRAGDAESSYIAKLFAKGTPKIAQKVGEEGVEVALACVMNDRPGVINESADLLFHLLIALEDAGVSLEEVLAEMTRREGTSGLTEKSKRA